MLSRYNAVARRVYVNTETKERSIWLLDVMPKDVIVRPSIECLQRDPPGPFRNTMFDNVVVASPRMALEPLNFATMRQCRTIFAEPESVLPKFIDMYLAIIQEVWQPDKFHFVQHSSGYDSRILSALIKRLHRELGDSWLGDVLFVCTKWEAEGFKRIMRYQGWDESQYHVVNEDVPDLWYHSWSINFLNAWKRLNCIMGMPINLMYYPLAITQEQALVPPSDEVQAWTANLATDYSLASGQTIFERYKFLYYHGMGNKNYKDDWIWEFPSAHHVFIRTAAPFSLGLEHGQVKREICRLLDPGLLALPNQNEHDTCLDYSRRVANPILNDALCQYQESAYGRAFPMTMNNRVEWCDWWARWSVASFCEYLIRQGYNVRIVK
jgi:hypothetical protein